MSKPEFTPEQQQRIAALEEKVALLQHELNAWHQAGIPQRTLVILLAHYTKVPQRTIKLVLEGIENLYEEYFHEED